MNQPSNSLRAVVKRVVAGGLLLFSLFSLGSYWNYLLTSRTLAALLTSRTLAALLTDPVGSSFSLAVTAMLVGVAVASLGVATETFDQHRDGYLRAMRLCGAVGLVGVGGLLVAIVVVAP